MKSSFTKFSFHKFGELTAIFAITVYSLVSLQACASTSGQTGNKPKTVQDTLKPNEKVFSFVEKKDGNDINWKVIFDNNKISKLYKNNVQIPEKQIKQYKDLVYDNLYEVQSEPRYFTFHMKDFPFDSTEFKKDMEHLKSSLRNLKFDSTYFPFDKKAFKEEMKNMSKELHKLKDMKFDFKFDTTEFRTDMEKLKNHIKKMKFNHHSFYFDYDNSDINMSGLESRMSRLKDELKDLKLNLKDLDKKLSKLKSFLKDVKHELVKDGYIKIEDEHFSMELGPDKMTVNGKELPNNLLDKYKKIYKQNFGKEISRGNPFKIYN